MHRSLHELRSASPNTEFIAYPVINSDLSRTNWFANPDVLRTMISEYAKFVRRSTSRPDGIGKGNGLRD